MQATMKEARFLRFRQLSTLVAFYDYGHMEFNTVNSTMVISYPSATISLFVVHGQDSSQTFRRLKQVLWKALKARASRRVWGISTHQKNFETKKLCNSKFLPLLLG